MTPTPEPTDTPSEPENPEQTITPTPEPEGEYEVRYYIPTPPQTLLTENRTYTISYENNQIVLSDGTTHDYYVAATPYTTTPCDLDTDVTSYAAEVADELSEVLATRLQEYHADTTVQFLLWYDLAGGKWDYTWVPPLANATLTDKGMNLYAGYEITVPYAEGDPDGYRVSCLPVVITVQETGTVYCLSLPSEATLQCASSDGTTLQWIESGTGTDSAYIMGSSLTQLTLSVTQ